MNVTFFTNFSKRHNSTKQPTGGTTKTVALKESTSIETPTFTLAESLANVKNITAALWDGRYYTLTDCTSIHNNVTELSFALDRMATFKSQIGATEAFIERCASGYNLDIRDEHIMTTAETFVKDTSGGSFLPSNLKNGVVVLALANISPSAASGGTSQLVYFDSTGGTYSVHNLMNALYDNSVISSIEKMMAKPYDAILSVRYIPGFTTADLINTGLFAASNILYFGDYSYTMNSVKCTGAGPWTYTKTYEFDLDLIEYNTIYKWRNYEPYSSWSMFLPFYGTISIPAAEYIGNEGGACNLYIKATVDLTTGELVYTRYRRIYTSGVATDYFAQEYRTTLGVDIPIQSANRDMLAFATDIVTGAGQVALMLATGGQSAVPGAVAMGAGAAGRAVIDVAQQNYLTAGSFNAHGTQIATAEPNVIYITQTGFKTQTTPTNYVSDIGGPYMKADTISNHSGYIKCNDASVSIPGTEADRQAVNTMLNSGFFYE